MKTLLLTLLLPAFFLFFCKSKSEDTFATSLKSGTVEGTYEGYRSQQKGQQPATDSTKITLKVTRLAADQVQILQTLPNEFKYVVSMKDNHFTYDRGIVEAACGVAHIKGEGNFQDNSVYLIETLECTKNTSVPNSFIRLRAMKK
ncbi:hypothetical protein [Persicitalea sp.]|uniref:hypothetical protein n=1 Tax=Persicitalea sp. TaxID=3100273 RepID=UPI003593DBFD